MKWFKHDSNAHSDAKLKRLKHKYGITGYGIYWYCVELIAGNIEKSNITFELEEDAELIALEWSLDQLKVQEIMLYMVELGLFEHNSGRITCLKLAKRLDDTNAKNPQIREIINQINSEESEQIPKHSEKVGVSPKDSGQIRLDQTRLERSKDISAAFDVFWFSGMKKTEKPTALASFKKVLSKPIDSPLSEKPKRLEPLEFANFLKQDIEMRLSSGQLGFDKLAPHRYLNKQRWNDEYENNSTERRTSTPASRSIEAAKKLCG